MTSGLFQWSGFYWLPIHSVICVSHLANSGQAISQLSRMILHEAALRGVLLLNPTQLNQLLPP